MSTVWDELAPSNKVCRHGLDAHNPDMLLGLDAFVRLPQDIREAATTCPKCARIILRGADDDASRSLQQRAWYALTATPLTREPLTSEQRAMLAALTASAEASLR